MNRALRGICFVSVWMVLGCAGGTPPTQSASAPGAPAAASGGADDLASRVFEAVNGHRISVGLSPLTRHGQSDALAAEHTRAMASGAVALGHSGSRGRYAALAAGAGMRIFAENVSRKRVSEAELPAAVVAGWRDSPSHRTNMEGAPYRLGGVGVVPAADGMWYVTLLLSGP